MGKVLERVFHSMIQRKRFLHTLRYHVNLVSEGGRFSDLGINQPEQLGIVTYVLVCSIVRIDHVPCLAIGTFKSH